MQHIEFLGPPGAGKSTIFSKLIKFSGFYGGPYETAIQRAFRQRGTWKHRAVYKLIPRVLQEVLEESLIGYRFRRHALEDFFNTHPEFTDTVSMATTAVTQEPGKVFSLCMRCAEDYQLGAWTVKDTESLCLDEGFAQRAFATLFREPTDDFSLERYFASVPIPDGIVYVETPPEVCLERQQERGKVRVRKEWKRDSLLTIQKEANTICKTIRDYLSDKTSVIDIKGTGSVRPSIRNIVANIQQPSVQ